MVLLARDAELERLMYILVTGLLEECNVLVVAKVVELLWPLL